MSIERDLAGVLHELEHQRIDPWGTHAKRLAEGIERSGVPALLGQVSDGVDAVESAVRSSGSQVTASIVALAAVNAAGFEAVCGALARQTEALEQIELLLANPLSTAAAERYRRGVRALQEGWYDDAVIEMNASIEQDPFQALSHYSLGLALGALDRSDDALPSFMSAIKYCGSDPALAPIAAGAALLAANTAENLGRKEAVASAIAAGLDHAPDCAELLLAKARHTGDERYLKEALSLAPELALPAVAAGVPHADEVAAAVHDDSVGPIVAARAASESAALLGIALDWPDPVPDAMTFHHQWRLGHEEGLAQLATKTRAEKQHAESASLRASSAVSGFAMPVQNSPYVVPLVIVVAGLLVALVGISSLGSHINNDPEYFPGGLEWAGGLGFWVVVGVTWFWLFPAIGDTRRESEARVGAQARLAGLKHDASIAASNLEDARRREGTADAISRALDQACPKRTIPLAAPAIE